MDGTSPPARPARSILGRLANIVQWIVFAATALLAIAISTELRKASVPGAPVALLYSTVAASLLLAMAHLPAIFRRLPRRGKWAAYGSILAVPILFGVYLGQMSPAWERTPEGAKEAAERAEADREAAAAQAREDARLRAERAAQAEAEAVERRASLEAQRQSLCDSLVQNVIELSQEGVGPKVVEINDVEVQPLRDAETLECSGTAILSWGPDRGIDFGIRTTPQGKDLVTMQLR